MTWQDPMALAGRARELSRGRLEGAEGELPAHGTSACLILQLPG